jgi:hypothetical protein
MKRLTVGFAAAFIMLTAIWFIGFRPKDGEYRLLQAEEAIMVRGGSSGGGVFSGLSGSAKPVDTGVNISLGNVPYVTQYIYKNNAKEHRSNFYCGFASALMARAKLGKNDNRVPILYNPNEQANYSYTDADLVTMDNNTRNGYYNDGETFAYYEIDVAASSRGLVYSKAVDDTDNYNITTRVLRGLYKGKFYGSNSKDTVTNDNGHVSNVLIDVHDGSRNAILNDGLTFASKAIWDHILNYNQPVVVLVDSNKQKPGGGIQPSSSKPTLHYIVVMGIKEEAAGGTRHFFVHDPADPKVPLDYTENDLLSIMVMDNITNPDWVYWYPRMYKGINYPVYILMAEGD